MEIRKKNLIFAFALGLLTLLLYVLTLLNVFSRVFGD